MKIDRLKIAVISGEESGDILACDLIVALRKIEQRSIDLVGIGGPHLDSVGLESWFNREEISKIGLKSIILNIGNLYKRLRQTIRNIIQERPDCLIVVDCPEFSYRVARAVRKIFPKMPIIQYVAPTVWAWRPKRAKSINPFIDHILSLFPFEENVMRKLSGPPTTYVGHPLVQEEYLKKIAKIQKTKEISNDCPAVLLLPGSRKSELHALFPIFLKAVSLLKQENPKVEILCVTLPSLKPILDVYLKEMNMEITIYIGHDEKIKAYEKATIALAASGTVSLELALASIPTILSYKLDGFFCLFLLKWIKIWSAALPNIITGYPIIPEYYNDYVKPEILYRQLLYYLRFKSVRAAQMEGFCELRSILTVKDLPSKKAAEIVLSYLKEKKL